ncbi:WG repeat-containing protein [Ihubacter sp. rT4E-8]|uniref:WG repeat-containing protein n=1 Tax=Ihubacter sp. rT4E-8 TaxID=3242369 RepID=UPI003CEC9A45
MKKDKKYQIMCIALAAAIMALAVICGMAGWRAAAGQEKEMAYLRGFHWELPLTENYIISTYSDKYFHTNAGGDDPADRAKKLASLRGILASSNFSVFDDYVGDQKTGIMRSDSGDQRTFTDAEGDVFFKNKDTEYMYVESLSDNYAVLVNHYGETAEYKLTDLQGNVILTLPGQKLAGIDNRYVAVGNSRINVFDKVYDMETGKIDLLPLSCTEIARWSEGWYKAVIQAAYSDNFTGFSSGTVFLDEDMNITMNGAVFDEETYYSANLTEGLFYGVKQECNVEGNLNSNEPLPRGYFDKKGKQVVETVNASLVSDFSEGKGIVYTSGGKAYCIDREGHILFEKSLTEKATELEQFSIGWKSAFRDGHAVIFDGKKCGVVDETGKWIVEPVFEQIYLAAKGRVVVIRGEKFGVLQLKGGTEK